MDWKNLWLKATLVLSYFILKIGYTLGVSYVKKNLLVQPLSQIYA